MKAYRVWCVFADGTETLASVPYELKQRADAICGQQTKEHQDRRDDGLLWMRHEVREEEIPRDVAPMAGEPTRITHIVLGNDESWTNMDL